MTDIRALRRMALDGPLTATPKSRALIEASLAVAQAKNGDQVPLDLLETRAVVPADVGTDQQPIIPGVFPMAAITFMGVDVPWVGVGEGVCPVLTTNATVHTPTEGTEVAEG